MTPVRCQDPAGSRDRDTVHPGDRYAVETCFGMKDAVDWVQAGKLDMVNVYIREAHPSDGWEVRTEAQFDCAAVTWWFCCCT